MRLGIGGGIGPLRAGISNKGVGGGIGPLSAGTSFGSKRRGSPSDDSSGMLGMLVWGAVVLLALLVWPYWLATWIAVEHLDAGRDSVLRRVLGWSAEGLWLGLWLLVGIHLWRARSARQLAEAEQAKVDAAAFRDAEKLRLAEEYERSRLEANEAREEVVRAVDGCRRQLAWLQQHPRGVASGDKPRRSDERLYARYDAVAFTEPRSVSRGGPREQTGIDQGNIQITTRGMYFQGSRMNREWRWDRCTGLEIDSSTIVVPVSSRQVVSGIEPRIRDGAAVLLTVQWALGEACGEGPGEAVETAKEFIDETNEFLQEHPPLGPLEEEVCDEASPVSGGEFPDSPRARS